ncbi:hypothetical protein [Variovorax boronicumulans]
MLNNTIFNALDLMPRMGRTTGHGLRDIPSTTPHQQDWPRAHLELRLAYLVSDGISTAQDYALNLEPIANMTHCSSDYQGQLMTRATGIGNRKDAA